MLYSHLFPSPHCLSLCLLLLPISCHFSSQLLLTLAFFCIYLLLVCECVHIHGCLWVWIWMCFCHIAGVWRSEDHLGCQSLPCLDRFSCFGFSCCVCQDSWPMSFWGFSCVVSVIPQQEHHDYRCVEYCVWLFARPCTRGWFCGFELRSSDLGIKGLHLMASSLQPSVLSFMATCNQLPCFLPPLRILSPLQESVYTYTYLPTYTHTYTHTNLGSAYERKFGMSESVLFCSPRSLVAPIGKQMSWFPFSSWLHKNPLSYIFFL